MVVCHGVVVTHSWGTDLPAETTDESQQLIDRYVAQLAAAGIPATGEVRRERENGMGDTLIDVAKGHQAGLIVVGTRGRSNVKSMLLGQRGARCRMQVHAAGAGGARQDRLAQAPDRAGNEGNCDPKRQPPAL